MAIPSKIPIIPTQAVASYDYTDIAEGTGLTTFYGLVSLPNGVYSPTLSQNPIMSYYIEHSNDSTNPMPDDAFAVIPGCKWDFDLPAFNLAKTIGGTAVIQHCFLHKNYGGSTGDTSDAKLQYIVKKVSNGVETTLGSQFSLQSQSTPTNTYSNVVLAVLPITLIQTHFKKGDILRLSVQAWAYQQAGGDRYLLMMIGTDPKNRDGTEITPSTDTGVITQLIAQIPFRIDIA